MATILNILALVLLILNDESRIYSAPSLTLAKIYLQVAHQNKSVARVIHNRHSLQRQAFVDFSSHHKVLLFDLIEILFLFSMALPEDFV